MTTAAKEILFFLTKATELLLGGSEWFRPLRDPDVD